MLPGVPVISRTDGPYQEGDNVTLVCRGNIGRPAGHLVWYRKQTDHDTFHKIPHDDITSAVIHHGNGTSSAIIKVDLHLQASDDGSDYKCEASSRAMRPWEAKPYATRTITVLCKLYVITVLCKIYTLTVTYISKFVVLTVCYIHVTHDI